ncbi:MAG: metallophosphoesterase [Salibacteraceae bacterium]
MNRLFLFLILSGAVLLFDLYAYQGLKVLISGWGNIGQRIAKSIFWGLTLITLLSFLLYEPLSTSDRGRKFLMIFATIGVANILGKFLFAFWLLIDDLIRLIRFLWTKLNPSFPAKEGGVSRSEFLSGVGVISASLPILSMSWGVMSGAHDYTVKRRDLKLKNLPASFDGYTILQLSDIHAGSFWNRKAVERGIDIINNESADTVFFTGDIVNNKAEELVEWIDVFGKIKAKDGVFSVLGNHDYGDYVPWESPEDKQQNLWDLISLQRDKLGWDLLINENRLITKGNDRIAVLGIENWGARGRFPKYGDLSKAFKGVENEPVKLLLSHDPSHWREQVIPEFPSIDVTFSGHTHGMQFGIEIGSLKWSPVQYFYPEWADLYKQGEQMLYVNRGFGYIGYPGRFGILPEITVFTLKKA